MTEDDKQKVDNSPNTQDLFHEQLTTLISVTNELSKVESSDLCRRAVELGRSKLGFDRLSIWFFDEGTTVAHGSFGTDEKGNIRDDRDRLFSFESNPLIMTMYQHKSPRAILLTDSDLYDFDEEKVGRGDSVIAPVWDGEKAIGCICVDNLVTGKPITEQVCEILALYASSLGHLILLKEAQDALSDEKERLTVTLRSLADGVISTNANGEIILMNKSAESLTGWSEDYAMGQAISTVFQIIDEESEKPSDNPVYEVVSSGEILDVPDGTILISKDGKRRLIARNAAPIRGSYRRIVGVIIVFRDITEKRKEEDELQRTVKLESLGILAGGIAHDFNNILTSILGNINLSKTYSDPKGKVFKMLAEAENASLRARDLTLQLLTFSKGGVPIKRIASVSDLLEDTSIFVLRGSNVRCDLSISADLWDVEIDVGQMGQVINNLVINAKQSMPEGGVVKISAENVTVDSESNLSLREGKHVRILIQDHGVGIPKDDLSRIFDPYFTTKEKASGLGLAITYSIIKKHDGYVAADSEEGAGATFCIYLPVAKSQHPPRKEAPALPETGKGRVLIMDDEELVLKVGADMLDFLGYETEAACDGAEAIEKYIKARKTDKPFDAVIMDLTIPGGMGGKEAAGKLIELCPDAKLIVSSGYSNDPIMAHHKDYGFAGVVKKPYVLDDLSDLLDEILH